MTSAERGSRAHRATAEHRTDCFSQRPLGRPRGSGSRATQRNWRFRGRALGGRGELRHPNGFSRCGMPTQRVIHTPGNEFPERTASQQHPAVLAEQIAGEGEVQGAPVVHPDSWPNRCVYRHCRREPHLLPFTVIFACAADSCRGIRRPSRIGLSAASSFDTYSEVVSRQRSMLSGGGDAVGGVTHDRIDLYISRPAPRRRSASSCGKATEATVISVPRTGASRTAHGFCCATRREPIQSRAVRPAQAGACRVSLRVGWSKPSRLATICPGTMLSS